MMFYGDGREKEVYQQWVHTVRAFEGPSLISD